MFVSFYYNFVSQIFLNQIRIREFLFWFRDYYPNKQDGGVSAWWTMDLRALNEGIKKKKHMDSKWR